jgi:serine/threonine protein kinase
MKCPRCQYDNPAETNYCAKCGFPLFRKGEEAFGPTLTLETPVYSLERGGTFADRYEIIEEVGKGGMGRVYKVFDRKIKENIALKLLKPEIAADLRTIERFRNELKFARKISHPHVCRMYDLGEIGQMHYITMEYVTGEDLKSFIRRAGHLTEPKALAIAEQITEGLAEAHRLGVIHRDLKPQNVMIDRDGNAKVMDFGIARSLHAAGFTGSGIMVGTPEYMSPEQAEASGVDQRSDIYSLGIIIYEMVTGKVPFSGETPLSVALKQKTEIPRNPRELNAMISEELSRLVMKCLEKEKEDRYQTAAELRADLDRIEKGLPTVEREAIRKKPVEVEAKPSRFKFRRLIVPALVLFAVAYTAVRLGQRQTPRDHRFSSDRMAKAFPGEKIPPAEDQAHFQLPQPPAAPSASGEKYIPDNVRKWLDKVTSGSLTGGSGTSKIISPILRGAIEEMNPRDLDEAQKQMELIRKFIPQDSQYQMIWADAYAKVVESQRHKQAGQDQESEKSLAEGQNRMRQLLDMVDQREKADTAKAEMDLARRKAEATRPPDKQGILFRVADAKEGDAAEAYAREDFAGARTLYQILARVFELSQAGADDDASLTALKSYLREVKTRAATADAKRLASWQYQEAAKEEMNAEALTLRKDYNGAAEACLRAAFLYEKASERAAESAPRK